MKAAVLSGDDLRRRKSLALSPPQHSHVAIKRGEIGDGKRTMIVSWWLGRIDEMDLSVCNDTPGFSTRHF